LKSTAAAAGARITSAAEAVIIIQPPFMHP
jgi:hypothetical protein